MSDTRLQTSLDQVLSIPSVKAEHPNLHAGATDELTTLRAQLAESQKANERLVRRLNWIRVNPNDAVAIRFAIKATDEEIDDIKHLVNTD